MGLYLSQQDIRLFDYARFAQSLRDEIQANTERIAHENGIGIEYIRFPKAFRKDDRIKEILDGRGNHPGLVHIFSALETCPSFVPRYDKTTSQTSLRRKDGKCLHYYFYFIDAEFGLCYMRGPTWAPFRLQFYCNGHNHLANQLRKEQIGFTQLDNAFLKINDFSRAQELADAFPIDRLHCALDAFAKRYCPVIGLAPNPYHWTIRTSEWDDRDQIRSHAKDNL